MPCQLHGWILVAETQCSVVYTELLYVQIHMANFGFCHFDITVISYPYQMWLITVQVCDLVLRKKKTIIQNFLISVCIFQTKIRQTNSPINLNTHDPNLDPSLTRDSVAQPTTFDLCDIIHHQTQTLVCVVKGPLNGPEWTSHFTFIVTPFSLDLGSQWYVGPHLWIP